MEYVTNFLNNRKMTDAYGEATSMIFILQIFESHPPVHVF
jgi:hypothetical protein